MNRKSHIIGGFVIWAFGMLLLIWQRKPLVTSGTDNVLWIVLSLLTCLLGAEMADFDLLWKSFLRHRNILTHSIILPGILIIPVFFVQDRTNFLLPAYGSFLLGYASHLLLDLFPSWKEDKYGRITEAQEAMTWLVTGVTGKELYTVLRGTYLVHLPWYTKSQRRTLNLKASRIWFVANALILIGFAIIIMLFFDKWVIS